MTAKNPDSALAAESFPTYPAQDVEDLRDRLRSGTHAIYPVAEGEALAVTLESLFSVMENQWSGVSWDVAHAFHPAKRAFNAWRKAVVQ